MGWETAVRWAEQSRESEGEGWAVHLRWAYSAQAKAGAVGFISARAEKPLEGQVVTSTWSDGHGIVARMWICLFWKFYARG